MARGLGKGIDAILPNDININRLVPGVVVQEIEVTSIVPNPEQPRRTISEFELSELAQSIAEHGVLQPLLVSKTSSGYQVIAGERRLRAATQAGLSRVPCIVRTLDDLQTLQVALIENMQRQDLSPLEQAVSIKRLHDDFGQTYEQVAKSLGRAYASVANTVRLLKLPEEIQNALAKKQISEGHARSLLALQDTSEQMILFKNIIEHGWSVRRAEQYVVEVKASAKIENKKVAQRHTNYLEDEWTASLTKKLNSQVVIQPTAKGGYIKIEYKNDDELSRIKSQLSQQETNGP
ncbi:ParB/RepB/Spo0J family partition protein [Candidatus Saccharibacteria bacterium]|nr:ParB/RepB/Spo0J family partition protein [Candidatus Saccharibacteria bacterium]MCB9821314.1 ParB/RepB/Spo0J family partition protein [Candidatus Nomurabacteria bacterium]